MSLKARIAAYDQAAAAAAAATRCNSAPASIAADTVLSGSAVLDDDEDDPPFQDSPDSCAASSTASDPSSSCPPSSSSAPSTSPPSSVQSAPSGEPCRPNEHLAVLIPRDLWKPDSLARHCDKYACRVKFSLFERKHHCRRCGGVFCNACSARSTSLLDTARLPFLLPPKGKPIASFGPVHQARVCDDCFEVIHGYPTPRPRSPSPPPAPIALARSFSTLSSLAPTTPPDARSTLALHMPPRVKTTTLPGDLNRYPLKDPSATCKAAGGGRWAPTYTAPTARWDGRLPDGRLRLDAEADKRQRRRERREKNPVIVDGPIRVRRPPRPPRIGPPPSPTF